MSSVRVIWSGHRDSDTVRLVLNTEGRLIAEKMNLNADAMGAQVEYWTEITYTHREWCIEKALLCYAFGFEAQSHA